MLAADSGRRTLVLGGARSGKSSHAESLAGRSAIDGRNVRYIATARNDPTDEDWILRIERHRSLRPPTWTTVEVADGVDLVGVLEIPTDDATVVDDLGTWLTRQIDDAAAWDAPRGTVTPSTDHLVRAVREYPAELVLVTPEVGMGVIPATRAGRLFRDEIGLLNSRLAEVCDDVVLVVAGIAVTLK